MDCSSSTFCSHFAEENAYVLLALSQCPFRLEMDSSGRLAYPCASFHKRWRETLGDNQLSPTQSRSLESRNLNPLISMCLLWWLTISCHVLVSPHPSALTCRWQAEPQCPAGNLAALLSVVHYFNVQTKCSLLQLYVAGSSSQAQLPAIQD